MLFQVIILSLISASYGMPTGQPDLSQSCLNMTWACHDIGVTKKCDKISNCIEIWEKIKAPQDNNEICDICKDMVKQARDQLLSNETQEEMKEVFEGSCNLLPIAAVAAECRKVVDELVPELIEMLASRMDPNMVCTVAGLCNNGKLTQMLKDQFIMSTPLLVPVSTERNDCDNCKQGMTFVRKALPLIPKSDFINLLLRSCFGDFHGTTAQCQDFMREIGPTVYNFLKVVNPDVFCGQMTVCPTIMPMVRGVGDNMTCEFCESLVQYLKGIVGAETTKDEFRTALKNFCADLKEFSDQCTNLVDEYFDQVYNFILNNLNPPEVCGALGLCNGQMVPLIITTPARSVETLPVVAISPDLSINTKPKMATPLLEARRQPHSHMPGIKIQAAVNTRENKYKKYLLEQNTIPQNNESNSVNEIDTQQLPVERFMPPSMVNSESESMNCEVCKTLVAYLEQELKDPKEEAQIRKVLEQACNVLPTELVDQCKDFIETNMDYLITLILQEASPDMICSLIKACPSVEETNPNFLPCQVCKRVMQYVEQEIGGNKTEEVIKNALEKACSFLPKSWGPKCTSFVDEYTDMIIDLITKDVAPEMVCAALGLCPFDMKMESELECTVCQYVLHYLQGQLMDNATEDEIKAEIDKVCSVMPKTLSDNCQAFIDEFGSSLLVLIAQKLDPSVVCVNMKVCPGKGIYTHESVASHTIQSLKLDTCSTCQMIVDYMDKLLENDDVDTEITKLIEKICNIIPMASRDQCASIIEIYGPYVLQMIGQLSNSKEVCQAVDLCSRNTGHVQLLGGEKCSYGPSYWCQSSAHASACNAEPFCSQQGLHN